MATDLSRHNRNILASKNTTAHPPCNCRCKDECPLNSTCNEKAIIYKASISTDSNDSTKCYYGCGKQSLNPVFAIIVSLFRTCKKEI